MGQWKHISQTRVFENTWRPVDDVVLENPAGKRITLSIQQGQPVVIICAVTDDHQFLIIQDFFPAQLKQFPSLPAGMCEEGEDLLAAAERELLEETGYTAERIVSLGNSLAGKYSNFSVHYLLALGIRKTAEQQLEAAEDIVPSLVSQEMFERLVDSAALQCVFDLACAYRALAYFKKQENTVK